MGTIPHFSNLKVTLIYRRSKFGVLVSNAFLFADDTNFLYTINNHEFRNRNPTRKFIQILSH